MNVFRHAQATQVKVAMEATDAHFKLRVADNGRGMPIDQARSGPKAISFGVGIPAMRARLRQMGGTLEIHSSSATGRRGTTLCAVTSALSAAQESSTAGTASKPSRATRNPRQQ